MTLIVNLVAGPGTGKSTTAAGLFAELKLRGIETELVTEYAKDRVWDEHFAALDNQIYIFGKQYHRMHRLLNKVDVVVTDAPIIFGLYYGKIKMPQSFKQLVLDVHNELDNLNIFLRRTKKYNPNGRMQTEEQALEVDRALEDILKENKLPYIVMDADRNAAVRIADEVVLALIERA